MPSSGSKGSSKIVVDALFSDYPFPGFLTSIRKRAEEFERAHPEYHINIRGCYYEDVPAQVAREAEDGHPPTIASYYSGATQQALDTVTADGRPLFSPMTRELGDRTEVLGEPVVSDDVIDACQHFYTVGGEMVAAPLTLSTMLLYTNTTMLRAAGVPSVPRTWAEFTDACSATAALDGQARFPATWPNDGKLFQQAVAQQGGVFVDNANGRLARATSIDLNADEIMRYVEWWRRLNERGHFLYTGAFEDWPGSMAAFREQRVAFRFGSSFEVDGINEVGRAGGFDVAVSAHPHSERTDPAGNWIGGDAIWLTADLDPATRDGALAFVQYLNNQRNAAEWHKATGSTPVTRGAIEVLEQEGWYSQKPAHRVATDQLGRTDGSAGASAPIFPGSRGVQTAIMAAMAEVLVEGVDPASRFTRATAEAQKALDEYNAICLGTRPRDPSWLVVGT